MQAGLIYKLKVGRKTPIGYMLISGENEIFLHNNEALYELAINDVVEVFLYYDSEKRLAATMSIPNATINNPGWGIVEDEINNGVFVNIGITKGILVGTDYLPYDKRQWPKRGDKLFIQLKEKGNSLIGKIVNNNDAKKYAIEESINIGE